VECLGTKDNPTTFEALEPADVYEKEKHVFQFKQLSDQKTEEYHDFRGCGIIR
jgi:hypothetical protein